MALTAAEQQQFNDAFGKAVGDDHQAVQAKALSPADAKTFFCDHYEEIKTALDVLQSLVTNTAARLAIGLVVKAVDVLHSTICK